MKAYELADAMYDGASLRGNWRTCHYDSQKPKFIYTLSYPNGHKVKIQESTIIGAMYRGMIAITSVWLGGAVEYGITDYWRLFSDAMLEKPGHLPLGLLLAWL